MLEQLIGHRALSILSDVMFCGALFAAGVGIVRVSYVQVYGVWPNNRGTRALAFVMELFSNALGAVNKGLVASGRPPLFTTPEADAQTAEIARLRARVTELAAPQVAPAGNREHLRAVTLPDVGARVSRLPDAPGDVPPVVIPSSGSE
jgi:hypothetical protein